MAIKSTVTKPKKKKEKTRRQIVHKANVVNAVIVDKETRSMICPECGSAIRGKILDYGATSDNKFIWFIRECSCGLGNKYLTDIGIKTIYSAEGKSTEEVATLEKDIEPATRPPIPRKKKLLKKSTKSEKLPTKEEKPKPKPKPKPVKQPKATKRDIDDYIFDF